VSLGEDAGDSGWNHEFTFHAFDSPRPGTVPIAVGHAEFSAGGWKYRVEHGEFAGDNGWEHDFVFHAFPADEALLIPVSLGYESEHWCTLLKECEHLEECYFDHQSCFYAFRVPYPGTVPVAIGQAGCEDDHTLRSRVSNECEFAGDNGWDHQFHFYAFTEPKAGTVPIAVGHAELEAGGWKYKVVADCEDAGTDGWEHDFTFHAYPAHCSL